MAKTEKFVIAMYVDNKFGVLTRVTGMFTRRGFNIDALAVGETESSDYSRITITLSGDKYVREQLINQLNKLHNVKKVEVLDDDCIKRQLMLLKVSYTSATRAEILAAVEVYRAKVIDYTTGEMCIEVTGDPSKIDAFIKLMLPFGILEMCRTGVVALERGNKTLFNND
ncbi:MAG: acetolactate synthase small subunit [Clostridia bacterium]|nr:acetolactate synthase small subunit [Clostridia bacterium]